jgi:hypothetical protein
MAPSIGRIKGSAVEAMVRSWAGIAARRFMGRDPFAAQSGILAALIAKGRNTRFGRDYRLGELSGKRFDPLYREYRSRVPIRGYEEFWNDYFAAGHREKQGKSGLDLDNVTWPGRIPFFCETSGTTASTKFIPFSHEMFSANRRAAREMAACYLLKNPESRLLKGKLLYMAGNTMLSDMGNGVASGDMSAITLLHPPSYMKSFVVPGPGVSALPWGEKLNTLAGILLERQDIRAISGVPPWILLLLKRCAELGGRPLKELLPGLELIIHGGAGMRPYRKEFDSLFGHSPPLFLELLPSSEAFMAFQIPGEDQMRFTPYYGVFFEFVPFKALDERGKPAPDAPAIPLEAVQAGIRYAVILTTCAGLWRYHIGDTVRFVSLDPLMIEFTGRDRFLDRFEEKVTQGEVEEAIARLNGSGEVEIREFIVGAEIEERRHLWVLAEKRGTAIDSARLAELLDSSLCSLNADYATFRGEGRIAMPRVVRVNEETIYHWSKEIRGKLGGQSKIPHIDPTVDGEMIRSLLNFINDEERGRTSLNLNP